MKKPDDNTVLLIVIFLILTFLLGQCQIMMYHNIKERIQTQCQN